MSILLDIAYNIIAPIALIVGLSVLIDRWLNFDSKSLARSTVYIFSPFLVLEGTANSKLSGGEAGGVIVMAVVTSLLITLLAWIVARMMHLEPRTASAFVISAGLINTGNYGIPLSRFAFGPEGEDPAIVYFVVSIVIANTLGVYLASSGTAPTRQAIGNAFKVPLPYAALVGLIINVTNATMPVPIERSVSLLSDAAIPVMLVVLGMQLSRSSVRGKLRTIITATGLRLVASPLIAVVLALIFGVTGLERQVTITQAGMPTAVMSAVLAAEFGSDSELVTAVIAVSTVLSLVTLAILLAFVM